jgi:hypothetical protein
MSINNRYFFIIKIVGFFLVLNLFFYLNNLGNVTSNLVKYSNIKLFDSGKKSSQDSTKQNSQEKSIENLEKVELTKCTKWIVITTISLPTDDVKYIHDSSFDWCVVVVADKKTPVNWSYKNVIFLSIEEQQQMAQKFKVRNKNSKFQFQRLTF